MRIVGGFHDETVEHMVRRISEGIGKKGFYIKSMCTEGEGGVVTVRVVVEGTLNNPIWETNVTAPLHPKDSEGRRDLLIKALTSLILDCACQGIDDMCSIYEEFTDDDTNEEG